MGKIISQRTTALPKSEAGPTILQDETCQYHQQNDTLHGSMWQATTSQNASCYIVLHHTCIMNMNEPSELRVEKRVIRWHVQRTHLYPGGGMQHDATKKMFTVPLGHRKHLQWPFSKCWERAAPKHKPSIITNPEIQPPNMHLYSWICHRCQSAGAAQPRKLKVQ